MFSSKAQFLDKHLSELIFKALKDIGPLLASPKKYSEENHEKQFFVITFECRGNRRGDNYFQPRPHEEDDDYPIFVAESELYKILRRNLGNQCDVFVDEHEKGWFSITIEVRYL